MQPTPVPSKLVVSFACPVGQLVVQTPFKLVSGIYPIAQSTQFVEFTVQIKQLALQFVQVQVVESAYCVDKQLELPTQDPERR